MQIPGLSIFKNLRMYMRNRHDPECAHAFAEKAWYAMLICAAAVGLAGTAYGGWLLYQVVYGMEREEAMTPTAETISREQLSNVLEAFQQRVMRHELLRANLPTIVDPAR